MRHYLESLIRGVRRALSTRTHVIRPRRLGLESLEGRALPSVMPLAVPLANFDLVRVRSVSGANAGIESKAANQPKAGQDLTATTAAKDESKSTSQVNHSTDPSAVSKADSPSKAIQDPTTTATSAAKDETKSASQASHPTDPGAVAKTDQGKPVAVEVATATSRTAVLDTPARPERPPTPPPVWVSHSPDGPMPSSPSGTTTSSHPVATTGNSPSSHRGGGYMPPKPLSNGTPDRQGPWGQIQDALWGQFVGGSGQRSDDPSEHPAEPTPQDPWNEKGS